MAGGFTLTVGTLRRVQAAVLPAASTNPAQPVLCGVHIRVGDGKPLTFTATDSYRLHRVSIATGDRKAWSCTVPATWLAMIKPPRGVKADDVVTFRFTGDRMFAELDNGLEWSTRVIAGDYPADGAEAILRSGWEDEGETALNPKYLAQALKAAEVWANVDPAFPRPVEVHALHPLKPCRLSARPDDSDAEVLDIILMPVRVHRKLRSVPTAKAAS